MVGFVLAGQGLLRFGTPEQKDEHLRPVIAAERVWCQLFSEPEAGSDLASLRTTAVADGDEYVVNGQKTFTTGGHDADYVWLACRTDPDAPKHKGISILIVDTSSPGFKWTPIHVVGGGHTNATYYEDVRVPVDRLVGLERVALGPSAGILRNLEAVTRWAAATPAPEGGRVIDREWVRLSLAWVRAKAEAARLFNWRVAWLQESGALNPADASAMKVYGTELRIESIHRLMEVLGPAAALTDGAPGALLRGKLEADYRRAIVGTFGGGVNEVQREIVGAAGLGLPRVPR
jgi:alkylation response protein AidB-like acyl-CoA dehydrogenase